MIPLPSGILIPPLPCTGGGLERKRGHSRMKNHFAIASFLIGSSVFRH